MAKKDVMLLHSFIDIETWNKAGWFAAAWAKSPDGGLPLMGCAFKDAKAGWKIFEDLQGRLGNEDTNELLRIAVIEGDIPGKDNPGYSVHIGSHYEHVMARAKADGTATGDKLIMSATRYHRMNPQPSGPNFLHMFKDEYAQHKQYLFLPFLPKDSSSMGVQPVFNLAIKKTELYFRRVEDIDAGDIDSPVLH